jgi:hypothetical protein
METFKSSMMSQDDHQKVDFSKPLVEEDSQDKRDQAVLRSHDQALETLILILYSYKGLTAKDIEENPKLQL